MARFPFDVVVFDLDGTLADTAADLAAALNHALERLGRAPVAPDLVRRLIGHGGKMLLRKGLAATGDTAEELVEEGYGFLLDFYTDHLCVDTVAFPGLELALDALAARGVRLAVCTNKSEKLSRELVEALGLSRRFASIVGPETVGARKPDPRSLAEAVARAGGGRAILVGDSIIDADTARAAGVPFVAVSFGFSDRPIEQLGADAIIDGYGELVAALEKL
jgi:phosphoglycolate phosphatase